MVILKFSILPGQSLQQMKLETQINPIYAVFKKTYERFLKIRGRPREISLGLALGLFIGMTPTMGFQIVIAVFFAALLKWNKISAAVGVWITNPFTAPFIYSTTYIVGAKLMGIKTSFRLPSPLNLESVLKMLEKAPEILLALTLGGVVLGLPLAVLGHFISYNLLEKYQEEIKKKVAKQKEKIVRFRAQRKEKKRRKKKNRK
ncbi:DUF2062 domain-containing protein [Thermodesulfobacteriota bacterium]